MSRYNDMRHWFEPKYHNADRLKIKKSNDTTEPKKQVTSDEIWIQRIASILVLSVVAFIVFVIIVSKNNGNSGNEVTHPGTGNENKQTRVTHPSVGEKGILQVEPGDSGFVFVCATKAINDRLTTLCIANDELGVSLLRLSGDVWLINSGTPVLVIETGWTGLLEVRILDGNYIGYSGFVPHEFVWSQ